MKKIMAALVALALTSVCGLASAQSSPTAFQEPSVQSTPSAAKPAGKAKAKRSKAPRAKKAKAR